MSFPLIPKKTQPKSATFVITGWIKDSSLPVPTMCAWHTAFILETLMPFKDKSMKNIFTETY
jgi:hypothetical protein